MSVFSKVYKIWSSDDITSLIALKFVYAPAQLDIYSIYNGKTEEGVAVFSRFPITSHNTFLLFR